MASSLDDLYAGERARFARSLARPEPTPAPGDIPEPRGEPDIRGERLGAAPGYWRPPTLIERLRDYGRSALRAAAGGQARPPVDAGPVPSPLPSPSDAEKAKPMESALGAVLGPIYDPILGPRSGELAAEAISEAPAHPWQTARYAAAAYPRFAAMLGEALGAGLRKVGVPGTNEPGSVRAAGERLARAIEPSEPEGQAFGSTAGRLAAEMQAFSPLARLAGSAAGASTAAGLTAAGARAGGPLLRHVPEAAQAAATGAGFDIPAQIVQNLATPPGEKAPEFSGEQLLGAMGSMGLLHYGLKPLYAARGAANAPGGVPPAAPPGGPRPMPPAPTGPGPGGAPGQPPSPQVPPTVSPGPMPPPGGGAASPDPRLRALAALLAGTRRPAGGSPASPQPSAPLPTERPIAPEVVQAASRSRPALTFEKAAAEEPEAQPAQPPPAGPPVLPSPQRQVAAMDPELRDMATALAALKLPVRSVGGRFAAGEPTAQQVLDQVPAAERRLQGAANAAAPPSGPKSIADRDRLLERDFRQATDDVTDYDTAEAAAKTLVAQRLGIPSREHTGRLMDGWVARHGEEPEEAAAPTLTDAQAKDAVRALPRDAQDDALAEAQASTPGRKPTPQEVLRAAQAVAAQPPQAPAEPLSHEPGETPGPSTKLSGGAISPPGPAPAAQGGPEAAEVKPGAEAGGTELYAGLPIPPWLRQALRQGLQPNPGEKRNLAEKFWFYLTKLGDRRATYGKDAFDAETRILRQGAVETAQIQETVKDIWKPVPESAYPDAIRLIESTTLDPNTGLLSPGARENTGAWRYTPAQGQAEIAAATPEVMRAVVAHKQVEQLMKAAHTEISHLEGWYPHLLLSEPDAPGGTGRLRFSFMPPAWPTRERTVPGPANPAIHVSDVPEAITRAWTAVARTAAYNRNIVSLATALTEPVPPAGPPAGYTVVSPTDVRFAHAKVRGFATPGGQEAWSYVRPQIGAGERMVRDENADLFMRAFERQYEINDLKVLTGAIARNITAGMLGTTDLLSLKNYTDAVIYAHRGLLASAQAGLSGTNPMGPLTDYLIATPLALLPRSWRSIRPELWGGEASTFVGDIPRLQGETPWVQAVEEATLRNQRLQLYALAKVTDFWKRTITMAEAHQAGIPWGTLASKEPWAGTNAIVTQPGLVERIENVLYETIGQMDRPPLAIEALRRAAPGYQVATGMLTWRTQTYLMWHLRQTAGALGEIEAGIGTGNADRTRTGLARLLALGLMVAYYQLKWGLTDQHERAPMDVPAMVGEHPKIPGVRDFGGGTPTWMQTGGSSKIGERTSVRTPGATAEVYQHTGRFVGPSVAIPIAQALRGERRLPQEVAATLRNELPGSGVGLTTGEELLREMLGQSTKEAAAVAAGRLLGYNMPGSGEAALIRRILRERAERPETFWQAFGQAVPIPGLGSTLEAAHPRGQEPPPNPRYANDTSGFIRQLMRPMEQEVVPEEKAAWHLREAQEADTLRPPPRVSFGGRAFSFSRKGGAYLPPEATLPPTVMERLREYGQRLRENAAVR